MIKYFLEPEVQRPQYETEELVYENEQKIFCLVNITKLIPIPNSFGLGIRLADLNKFISSLIEEAEKRKYSNIKLLFKTIPPMTPIPKTEEASSVLSANPTYEEVGKVMDQCDFSFLGEPCFCLIGERLETDIEFWKRQQNINLIESQRIKDNIEKLETEKV